MWAIALQFVWKILKDPKLLAIIVLAVLLAGSSVKGYWYKQKSDKLELRVDELNITVNNLKEINNKLTQNRNALAKQIEDLKEIDIKYKNLQTRIDALKKTCAKTVKPVVVSPSKPEAVVSQPSRVETKPEAPRSTISPGGESLPVPVVTKPENLKPGSGEGVKPATPEPEYQYGGVEYETLAKSIYNDLIIWFNSNDRVQPKGPAGSVSNPNLSISDKACPETVGYKQDIGSSRQHEPDYAKYERYNQILEAT